jgi:hypothetical protein
MPIPAARPLAWIALVLGLACSHKGEPHADATTPAATSSAALTDLDAAITGHWRAAGVTPVAAADDLALLRRASLDLLGRVPTTIELDTFAADPLPDRYERAIDRMLGSAEHAEHLASTWADVLVGGAIKVQPRIVDGTRDYLTTRLVTDVGFDRIATELLTAEGELADDAGGGFLAAHGRRGRSAALAGETARIFLAAQIQCAQCHDHPSAPFRQDEFYAFTAHFARTAIRPGGKGDELKIVERARGQQRLPTPMDPPDDPSGAIVAPAYFGAPTQVGDGTRREALAELITHDRRFALAIANRTWASMFGRGIVEPVDDIALGAPVPPLLDAVADLLVGHDYAIDGLLRDIALSQAYRTDSRATDDPARVAAFAQAAVRPLPIEPLVRSLATAGATGKGPLVQAIEKRRGPLRALNFAFDDDEGATEDAGPSLQEALSWLKGDLTAMVAQDAPGRALREILRRESTAEARIDALWWRFYARKPDADERTLALAHVADDPRGAAPYEDLVHAIVTSSEFTSNH